MMKDIKVIQTDLLTNESNIIYKGLSTFNQENGIKIKYFENSDIEVVIELIGNEGYLKRVSDEETHLNFDLNTQTSAYVKTKAGLILMEVKTHDLSINEAYCQINYDLIQQTQTIASFSLKVEW